LAKSGAVVVDMESYSIVSAAAGAGVPVVVLRVVSDSLDTEMPDFNRALNAQGALDGRKALWIAFGSPLQTLRLLGSNKRAIERLKPAVKLILESDCFSRVGSAVKNGSCLSPARRQRKACRLSLQWVIERGAAPNLRNPWTLETPSSAESDHASERAPLPHCLCTPDLGLGCREGPGDPTPNDAG
jgi:hypothetical protein